MLVLDMLKPGQIRDLDDELCAGLLRRAGEAGISVPELLRMEAGRLAAKPSVEEWLKHTRQRSSPLDRVEILTALDEQRGPWPDAGRWPLLHLPGAHRWTRRRSGPPPAEC